jgi:hypothetical protein
MTVNDSLDLDDVDSTRPEEIDAALMRLWAHRGPLSGMYAVSLQLDYAPDFAKLTRWASDLYGSGGPEYAVVVQSCQSIHSYMMLGWFSQMYAGMRGLGHDYHAVGDFLPMMATPGRELVFPPGWDPDPRAFRAGLDLGTRDLTAADEAAITRWYEQTGGYMPTSVLFGMKRDPRFLKLNRARWERALRTLPKQLAPYLMLRHHTITQSVHGLREAALLGRAWGLTRALIIHGVTNTAMYVTGTEGMYASYEVLEPIFDDWEESA